jgi:hypothetical protein
MGRTGGVNRSDTQVMGRGRHRSLLHAGYPLANQRIPAELCDRWAQHVQTVRVTTRAPNGEDLPNRSPKVRRPWTMPLEASFWSGRSYFRRASVTAGACHTPSR